MTAYEKQMTVEEKLAAKISMEQMKSVIKYIYLNLFLKNVV